MKFEDLKFMQLAGNCGCIGYLGKDRIKGPIDNVVTNGAGCIKLLIEDKYYKAVIDWADKAIQLKRTPNFEGDSLIAFKFKYVLICHNDPKTPEYKNELIKRCERFNNFLEKVKTDKNYYFTINLNENDVDRITHKLNIEQIESTIKYLKDLGILNKVIFISTKHENTASWWNFYSKEFDTIVKKFALKHILIENLDFTENTHNQFIKKVKEILKDELS